MSTKEKKKQQHSVSKIFSNNLFMLKIAFLESPFYVIHCLISVAKNRVIVFVEHIYMIGYVINAIINKEPFVNVLLFIGSVFLCITLWVNVWERVVSARIEPAAKQKIDKRIRMQLYKKAAGMDLKCYDDPDFYNGFVWAMSEATTRVYKVFNTTSSFIGHLVSIAVVGGYVLTQDAVGLVFVAVSFTGIFFFSNKQNKLRLALRERMKPWERKRDYISRVFYLSDSAKEIRLNRIKGKLYSDFNEASSALDKETRLGTHALAVCHFCIHYVFNTLMIDGLYLLYLLYRTIVGHMFEYGTMVTLFNSCNQIRRSLLSLSQTIPEFLENSLYIDKIRSFLNYENTISSPEVPRPMPESTGDIEFRNVSFAYGETPVLKNINLTIKRGERIALVGYNGAGKTTLVKLMMRLYDVSGGEILYNGRDIREYAVEDYRNAFGTVFQDYQLFACSIAENIVMDNTRLDEERAALAAEQSSFAHKLADFEKGYATRITKEFDNEGVLLSGGESQSLAITRALYKYSPVIILDEPSSALDPIAEYNLNHTMLNLCGDKTVIVISHRLSTTKMADKIYMLEYGQIIEQGTHHELMLQNGKYAEMFKLQAEKYNLRPEETEKRFV